MTPNDNLGSFWNFNETKLQGELINNAEVVSILCAKMVKIPWQTSIINYANAYANSLDQVV